MVQSWSNNTQGVHSINIEESGSVCTVKHIIVLWRPSRSPVVPLHRIGTFVCRTYTRADNASYRDVDNFEFKHLFNKVHLTVMLSGNEDVFIATYAYIIIDKNIIIIIIEIGELLLLAFWNWNHFYLVFG